MPGRRVGDGKRTLCFRRLPGQERHSDDEETAPRRTPKPTATRRTRRSRPLLPLRPPTTPRHQAACPGRRGAAGAHLPGRTMRSQPMASRAEKPWCFIM